MQKIEKITKVTANRLGELTTEYFKSIEDELGIRVVIKGGKFTDVNATLKFEFSIIGANGEDNTTYVTDWKFYCERYDFTEDQFGAEFKDHRGDRFTIAGIKPRSHTYPIIGKRIGDGKLFKFTAKGVKDRMIK